MTCKTNAKKKKTTKRHSPGPHGVGNGKDGAEQDAEAADDEVGDAGERVLAAPDGARRDDD